jgi:hypothetical protein
LVLSRRCVPGRVDRQSPAVGGGCSVGKGARQPRAHPDGPRGARLWASSSVRSQKNCGKLAASIVGRDGSNAP